MRPAFVHGTIGSLCPWKMKTWKIGIYCFLSKSPPDLQTFARPGQLHHLLQDPSWPSLSHQPKLSKMQVDKVAHVKSNFRSGEEGTAREGPHTRDLWGFKERMGPWIQPCWRTLHGIVWQNSRQKKIRWQRLYQGWQKVELWKGLSWNWLITVGGKHSRRGWAAIERWKIERRTIMVSLAKVSY